MSLRSWVSDSVSLLTLCSENSAGLETSGGGSSFCPHQASQLGKHFLRWFKGVKYLFIFEISNYCFAWRPPSRSGLSSSLVGLIEFTGSRDTRGHFVTPKFAKARSRLHSLLWAHIDSSVLLECMQSTVENHRPRKSLNPRPRCEGPVSSPSGPKAHHQSYLWLAIWYGPRPQSSGSIPVGGGRNPQGYLFSQGKAVLSSDPGLLTPQVGSSWYQLPPVLIGTRSENVKGKGEGLTNSH